MPKDKSHLTQADTALSTSRGNQSLVQVSEIEIASPGRTGLGDVTDNETKSKLGGSDIFGKLKLLNQNESYYDYLEHPSLDIKHAYQTYRLAPYLQSILDAIQVNVYGAGYKLEPTIDTNSTTVKDEIRTMLEYERTGGDFEADPVEITDEDVEEALKRYKTRAARERIFLESWFANCVQCPGYSYRVVSIQMGQDKGIIGTGYWEILRDNEGRPSRLIWAPAWSVRAVATNDLVAVETPVRKTKLSYTTERHYKRFRSFVQLNTNFEVIARFKEFGDPRIMSRDTGKYYDTFEEFYEAEAKTGPDGKTVKLPLPATELLDFRTPFSGSTYYGKAKWTGVNPDLVGARELAEENRLTVTDNTIPNMFLMIAGPRVDADFEQQLNEKLRSRARGRKKVIVINAFNQASAPSGASATPMLQIERTKNAQHTDGLGLNYTEQVEEKTRKSFRFPKVILGDDKNTDSGTAYAMFRFFEDQVADPERDEFDDRVNTSLFPAMNILCWMYKTQSRPPRDPELLGSLIKELSSSGVLKPNEGREIASDIFNKKLDDLPGTWAELPSGILTALLQTKNQVTAAAILDPASNSADFLENLHDRLLKSLQMTNQRSNGDSNERRISNQQGQPEDEPDDSTGDEAGTKGTRGADDSDNS